MRITTIGGLALLALAVMGRPVFAQSAAADFETALLAVASPAPQAVTAGSQTVEGVEAQEGAEAQEGVEAQEGPEAPEGVEAPEAPGDTGPNVDHQFEGEETGENGNGNSGQGSGR